MGMSQMLILFVFRVSLFTNPLLNVLHFCSNLLLNVGPMADGTLDPVFEERLLEMGEWLNVSHTTFVAALSFQNDYHIIYLEKSDWLLVK